MYIYDRLFLDGRWMVPATSDAFDVRSPHDGSAVGSAPIGTAADVDAAVAAARRAFDDGPWPRLTVEERLTALRPFLDAYARHTAELAALVTAEMGSPASFAEAAHGIGPLMLMQQTLEFAESYPWTERRGSSALVREPAGVVGIITPWNVPQVTIAAKLLPALIAGCTVVVKPAPETPLDAMLLAGLLAEADLPPGVAAVIPGATAAGRRLVEHDGVDRIAFTGSAEVGRTIAASCGQRLARCSLELGGKSAAIVCEDASVERTVAGLGFSSFLNNGQACVAQSRILAPRSRYDEVAGALAQAANAFVVGDPRDAGTDIGPLVSARQRERVRGYIELGVAEGATLAAGGADAIEGLENGQYVRPTVFRDVDNSMRIAREEIFGPVIVVIPYDGIDDAVRIANDSPYGLGGSVWTKDRQAGFGIARRVRTGMFGINSFAPEFGVPFGGFKASGIGREYGPEAFDEYVEMKSIYGVPA
ncbi:aldehyde dehydrogenase [Mycobacterium antarcticum]|uniref:aldehyde dehydrogenase n=1 Tax=unclassified Mycolicibacterium TaxID=2636767 RepID=UPI0023A6DAE6|nr:MULTISPECIES: aldehyde dehydrogenase [unclassified Mycolicibacterium]BDX32814.1 aldehyde dehydrogenase [Mycolicibacterium sp. TUM20985]GLP75998.1 aldehyde dehydrogenase [Mycolicibacterium sp. TUM20983]